jgi:hypothetical protein
MMLLNDDPIVGEILTLSHRIDKRRPAEGVLLYLVSVAFVAVATIVLFSVASISILGTSKETLTGSRVDNSAVEAKSISSAFFYTGSSAAPVPVQTESPSSSEANNLLSSTPAPQPSGMPREETVAKPPPDGGVSPVAVEIPNGSTQGPSTDEPPSPEVGGSQEVIAEPLLIAEEVSAAQHASGATMPPLATSDEQLDQISQNLEIRRNDYGNLDQGSAAFTTEEPQVKESTASYGSTVSPRSPPLRHAASHRASAVEADHNITGKLNRAELSRLLKGSRASLR